MTNESYRVNSPYYRFALTRDVLTAINRGECSALVGVGSCGKSRFLRHIMRPEIMQQHLGQAAGDHLIVLVECNGWVENSVWAAYEGMTRALMDYIRSSLHPVLINAQNMLNGMYEAVVAERSIAFKHVQTGLNALLPNTPLHLTFLFDEFDFVFERFDATLFRNLRALRNQHKYQLTYLTATRRQMPYQRHPNTWPDVEEFYELFSDNTFAIGPFEERDAVEMVLDLEARYNFPLHEITRSLLINVTGGHPGLLGATFKLLEATRQQPYTPQDMSQIAVGEQGNMKECRKIWESVKPDEAQTLLRIGRQMRLGPEDFGPIQELKAKGLVREAQGNAIYIFSPIFHDFCARLES